MEISHKVSKVVSGLKRAVEYFAQKRFNTNIGAPALGHMLIPKGSAENINIYISPKGEGGIGNAHIENLETNISLSFANVTIEPATGTSLILGGRTSAQITNSDYSAIINSDTGNISDAIGSVLLGTLQSRISDAVNSVVAGGGNNEVANGANNGIVGGQFNVVTSGNNNIILGGETNTAEGISCVVLGQSSSDRGVTAGFAHGFWDGTKNQNTRLWYTTPDWIDWNFTYILPSTTSAPSVLYTAENGRNTLGSIKLRVNICDDLGNVAHVEITAVYIFDIGAGLPITLSENNSIIYDGLTPGWVLSMALHSGYIAIAFTGVEPRQYRVSAYADTFDSSMPEIL